MLLPPELSASLPMHPLLALLRSVLLAALLAPLLSLSLLPLLLLAHPLLAVLAAELVLAPLLVLAALSPVLRLVLVVLSHSAHWAGTPGCGGLAARVSACHRVAYSDKVVHDGSRKTARLCPDVGRS